MCTKLRKTPEEIDGVGYERALDLLSYWADSGRGGKAMSSDEFNEAFGSASGG
jgi:hypothetical protein